MRILYVINHLLPGGAETLARDLILQLRRRGVDVDLFILSSTSSFIEREIRESGVAVAQSFGFRARKRAEVEAQVYAPVHPLTLSRQLAKRRYDLMHVNLFPAQLYSALAMRLSGRMLRMVTTEHSTRNRRRVVGFRSIDRWTYKHYSRIACVSSAALSGLRNWIPELDPRLLLIQNGIDLDRFSGAAPLRKEDVIAASGPVILCVGRLDYQKGQDIVLRALKDHPTLNAVFVGEGPFLKALSRLARDLAIERRVHFLGPRNDIARLLKMSDLYVQPSRVEGFGLATIEAMTAGVPVIAARVPGLAEVVADAALSFEAENSGDLSAAISLLLRDREKCATLVVKGREQARSFSLERVVSNYLDLYRDVTAANSGKA